MGPDAMKTMHSGILRTDGSAAANNALSNVFVLGFPFCLIHDLAA